MVELCSSKRLNKNFLQTDRMSAIDEIKRDHQEIKEYYNNYKNATTSDESNKWFHQFVKEVAIHSVGEECAIYPILASISTKGQQLVDKGREEHHKVKVLLSEVMKEKDPAVFDSKMDTIMENLLKHMEQEENEDLLLLADNVTNENLVRAGKAFSMKKKIVPTRPHPAVPEKPVALEAALGLLIAPIDKFRDLFTSFPDKDEV